MAVDVTGDPAGGGVSPLPREARPYQGHTAGVVTRLVAAFIDSLIVGVILLCGYVGIPDNRAARRKWARAGFRTEDLRVHGGVTFDCQIGGLRWIGFDCAHYQDVSPAVEANLRGLGLRGPGSLRDWAIASERLVFPAEQYRDLQYVTAEIEGLAAQLAPRLFAQATHTCTFGTRPTTTGRDCKRCQLLGMAECTVEDA